MALVNRTLLFVHINKAGGGFVTDVLERTAKEKGLRYELNGHHQTLENLLHFARLLTNPVFDPHTVKIFTVVRNPWARMVSMFTFYKDHHRQWPEFGTRNRTHNHTFDTWVRSIYSPGWPRNRIHSRVFVWEHCFNDQLNWLDGPNANRVTVLRLERYEDEVLPYLRDELGLHVPAPGEPVATHQTVHSPFCTFYTDETRALVAMHYARDIESFGYRFPGACPGPPATIREDIRRDTGHHIGYCGTAQHGGDCAADRSGSWPLDLSEIGSWSDAHVACQRRCRQCPRCQAISYSIRHADCSWFSSCELSSLSQTVVGFRSAEADSVPKENALAPLRVGGFAKGCWSSQSESAEEELLFRWVFRGMRGGTYVEIGGNDGRKSSNTLALHTCHGWHGLLVEASPRSAQAMFAFAQRERPGDVAMSGGVCAPPETAMRFVEARKEAFSTIGAAPDFVSETLKKRWRGKWESEIKNVSCWPMSHFLARSHLRHVDLFSLDVEGAELEVLRTIDFSAMIIHVFLIELDFSVETNRKVRHLLRGLGYDECVTVVVRSAVFVRRDISKTKYTCPWGVLAET